MRILLIDDDRDDYLITRELLAEVPGQPFELEWASDYDSGLRALASGAHEVCLLDYRLGARNGLDLLREAKAAGALGATVIMLTGQREGDLDNAALLGGVAAFLRKEHLDAPQLDRAIRYALTQSRHAEDLERQVAERTRELAAANESLMLADRRKDEFIAILAHELRNPLAPIVNALHILRARCEDPSAREPAFEMMERQLGHMVRLVDDLLDVGRVGSGKLELRRERVELASVVEQAVEAARPLAERLQQSLSVRLPREPVSLDADPARIAQVVGNLLNNASKFTPVGGRIAVSVMPRGDRVTIGVKDSGAGIAAGQLPRLFAMFSQLDSGIARSQGGLGIGLALAKTLVELHGGTIAASSEGPGRGSEFVVTLPALAPAAPDGPATSREPAPPTGVRRRILVVDDNRDAAESLAMLLDLDGHEVRQAGDGKVAIEVARTWQPELILLDLGLPQMSGYEVARCIRAEPRNHGVLIVATTGWGQDDDRRRTAEAGFDGHLVKPTEPRELSALIAKLGRDR